MKILARCSIFLLSVFVFFASGYGRAQTPASKDFLPKKPGVKYKRYSRFDQLVADARLHIKAGDFVKAEKLFAQALELAERVNDRTRMCIALGALGNTYIALGPAETARTYLTKAETLARELNNPHVTASILINFGNFYAFQGNPKKALKAYEEALKIAADIENYRQSAQALANGARLAVELNAIKKAETLLEQGVRTVYRLKPSREKNYLLINLASTYMRLAKTRDNPTSYRLQIYQLLADGSTDSAKLNDIRGISYAQGFLGHLYENEGRFSDALKLTQHAIFKAQQLNDNYMLYRWLWQKARIFWALGDAEQALSTYRECVFLLDRLRYRMSVGYQPAGSSFVESIAPVYIEFIDLLLAAADAKAESKERNALLIELRKAVERLKIAELRDYFRDECVDTLKKKSKPIWKASTSALVVYPLLLKDRTELLLDFPDGRIKKIKVPVNLADLTAHVRNFRKLLEKKTTNEYRIPGQILYKLLIAPLIPHIENAGIDTLAFVPDGPLFTIPFAALYDGKQHLIERYAIAITPGIELIDPNVLAANQINPVLGGLSQSVAGMPALPFVKEELQTIQRMYGGTLLLDQAFKPEALAESLSNEEVNVLHISTHSILGNSVDESYLLTSDGRLSINQLAEFVGLFQFRENPLELLVLSACETAQGDDKAALGLSGIAVRAGARSAVGTLWKVSDKATSKLIRTFYRQFKEPGVSRAAALRVAQRHLLETLHFQHPGYWSAFLLINNWL